MPNEPKPAAAKRAKPTPRQNAQDDAEGSPHAPEAFDAMNPAVQGLDGPSREKADRGKSDRDR